ncbi:MAG: hypothetical protein MJE77_16085 [Proteobacteria bacterium]|nr:hypothetical protein [Pseudomonadota bacterium]
MTDYAHHVERLVGIKPEDLEQFRYWSKALFRGAELPLFGGLIILLVIDRNVSARDIVNAIPDKIGELPWRGCEQSIFETLIDVLRKQDQNDAAIREFVERLSSLVTRLIERVHLYAPSPDAVKN